MAVVLVIDRVPRCGGDGDGDPTQPGRAGRVARLLVADLTGAVHAELPVQPDGRRPPGLTAASSGP